MVSKITSILSEPIIFFKDSSCYELSIIVTLIYGPASRDLGITLCTKVRVEKVNGCKELAHRMDHSIFKPNYYILRPRRLQLDSLGD